ncbi:MAG: YbaB/EbfC family nucleoid-associated protein [Candidatus Mycalebacterium zealandia]|nr:MAG: YbaB/EbfC family nucleoid-associated protein [Candidatus Mycalebacterium zealandia]
MKLGGGLKDLMKQAEKLKEDMEKVQNEAGEEIVEASSGGGMVTVTAKAKGEIMSIRIDPEIAGDKDTEMLEDLLGAAVNEALLRGKKMMKEKISEVTSGLGLPPGLL